MLIRNIIYNFLNIIIIVFWTTTSAAQQATLSVDKKNVTIGEPVTIHLKATGVNASATFQMPDSIPHFEIIDVQKPQFIQNSIDQQLTLISFDTGKFSISPFSLNAPGGAVTNSIGVIVTPVNVDTLKDYHDIKDIIDVPANSQWLYILIIAVVTLLALIGLIYIWRKKKLGNQKRGEVIGDPFKVAMDELIRLEKSLPQNSKNFYTSLIDIFKNYLNTAHHYHSHQRTGDELILYAKPLLENQFFYHYAETIRLSDAAKFAKYETQTDENKNSIEVIRQAISTLDDGKKAAENINISPKRYNG